MSKLRKGPAPGMPNCGFCKTALGDRQELLLDIAQVEPQK